MNSFTKKIALATATLVAMGSLIATPANASTVTANVTGGTGIGTAADPVVLAVPADNSVNTEAATITVTLPETNTATTITTTGAVRVVQAIGSAVSVDKGLSALTVVPTTTSFAFYAFTTSTTAGTVVVSIAGASTTLYVKGTAGTAYNVSLVTPSVIDVNSTAKANVTVTDVFGNAVAGHTLTAPSVVGITAGTAAVTDSKGVTEFTLTPVAGVTQAAVSVSLGTVSDVEGLPKAVKTQSKFVTVVDLVAVNDALVAENSALKAENAKLKADLESVTVAAATAKAIADKAVADLSAQVTDLKKAYNKLAKRWNAKNARKVALLK